MYQSYHRLRPVAVSVVPLLAVSCCISRFIARGRARRCIIYSTCCVVFSGQHQRPGSAVSFVPSPTVSCCSSRSIARGHRVSRCISRSVGCGQLWYSVGPPLVVSRCIAGSIACGQSLYQLLRSSGQSLNQLSKAHSQLFRSSHSVAISVVPSPEVIRSIIRSISRGTVSVVPLLAVSRCISRFIACCQSLYSLFHHLQSVLGSVVSSLSSYFTAHGQSLYQSLCSKSVISRRGEYM